MKRAAFAVAILAALALLASGPGTRFGWFRFTIGLRLYALTVPLAAIALLLALIVAFREKRMTPLTTIATGVAAVLLIVTVFHINRAFHTAPIHDITTDPADPPAFVAAVALRGPHTNPLAYGGSSVADWQRRTYPDIAPLILMRVSPTAAFARATNVATSLGWNITASVPAEGRLEATSTTSWFGFTDDVVVRIRPMGSGSRVDVRSCSRVGRGDAGENAKRVRTFLRMMQS